MVEPINEQPLESSTHMFKVQQVLEEGINETREGPGGLRSRSYLVPGL